MRPLALYIHVPYCLEKCPYCDFHSVAVASVQQHNLENDYANALIRQLEQDVGRLELKNRSLLSIFFGGGTPSLMSPSFFERVLNAVAQHFIFQQGMEITVETNPATATVKHFRKWRQIGINRVSFGVQSFHDVLLKKLGRHHSAREAKQAICDCLEVGFSNVSLDLIFGIEGQTLNDLKSDLRRATAFQLPHISAYQLTVEPATPLASSVKEGRFVLPKEETLVAMQNLVVAFLEDRGLQRYEISNYAKPGFESRHNLQYWRYGDYLGIGSGAVSFLREGIEKVTGPGKRWRTTRKLKTYLSKPCSYEDEETIDFKTAIKEKWMMGLRLEEGVFLEEQLVPLKPFLHQWKKEGVLRQVYDRVRLTSKGFLLCNTVTQNVFALIDKVC